MCPEESMPIVPGLLEVESPPTLWRVAKYGYGENFSYIDALSAAGDGGNRFDVPGGGVLYACTEPLGCFYETLSRFRTHIAGKTNNAAAAAAMDTDLMAPGNVPKEWRDARRKFEVEVLDAAPFVDVEAEETRAFLCENIPDTLATFDAVELDISDIRGKNRRLTRAIAKWVYLCVDEDENPLYSGIRYISRHNGRECWAIFDGTETLIKGMSSIERHDDDLELVRNLWGLTIH